jgi:glycosyltransferase involved in cell wall biosynthesis
MPKDDREARVLILVENAPVPFDRRVRQHAVALSEAGYEVAVVCPQGDDVDREPYEILQGVDIHRFALRNSGGGAGGYLREYASALWSIRRLIRQLTTSRPFDVIHACNPPDLLAPAVWALKRQGTRLIFDHHDLAPELYEARYGRRDVFYRALLGAERLAFRAADVVIATNESYRRIALERGGKPPEDVFVVRNAPDPERFRPVEPDQAAKRGRRFLIAYLGLMAPQDGIDCALRALAFLRSERDDWHAVFMGDGDVLEDMKRLAGDLDLRDCVEFTGRVGDEQILPTLSAADVCISPEPWNPLNVRSTFVKVVEYMAMARPIVAFDLAETRVSAGDAALYAPATDEEAFARQIAVLLDDAAKRQALGERGRERLERELGWHRSREHLLRAYAATLGRKRAEPAAYGR